MKGRGEGEKPPPCPGKGVGSALGHGGVASVCPQGEATRAENLKTDNRDVKKNDNKNKRNKVDYDKIKNNIKIVKF